MRQRVVVTGLGAVTPLGIGVEQTWRNLCEGRSGIGPITLFDASAYSSRIAGEVKEFAAEQWLDRREMKRMDRFTQLAMAAAQMAVEDSGLDLEAIDRNRVGVFIGSGVGGIRTLELQHNILLERGPMRVSPLFVPMMIADIAAGYIAIRYGARGPNKAVVTACASSAHAIGDAYQVIKYGQAKVMIVGGAEAAVTPLSVAGFCTMKALSTNNDHPTQASRPFDAERDGFVIAEGAGLMILESLEYAQERGARIYGEIIGYGMSGDAYHITAMAPGGEGAAQAMSEALADAEMRPEEIDYINAHGTSTELNDKAETQAIKHAFGEHARRVAISSTKSMTGHMLGASGAVELAACLLAIRDQIIPPTINYEHPDPECDLDYVPNQARAATVRAAMTNSFGFGGHNATLVVCQVS